MKKIVTLVVIIALLAVGGFALLKSEVLVSFSSTKSSDAALLKEKIVELSDWTTLKYEYSNVIISRTEKNVSLLGLSEVSYAEAIKLISYNGYLKAGTDFSKAVIDYDETSKILNIKLPKSTILDNVVETESTVVEDIKGNLFSEYPTQLVFDEINANKIELEKEKVDQGFLDQADVRVKEMLSQFLQASGYENYEITILE